MLLHIPDVISKQQVTEFRAQLQQTEWVDGRTSVGAQGAEVKRNHQLPAHSQLGQKLGEVILAALHAQPLFMAAALPLRIAPPLFNRYQGGEHYGLHVDGAIRFAADTGLRLRTDLSATLFLSEPEEYSGGELVVQDTYGSHAVKLPAGDLILYPSTSLHKVEAVTSGDRVCSFFWVQSMVRDDWQRTMLFELDNTIQSLREQLGNSPEVIQLTAHYHNLLRQWSEM